MTQLLSVTLGFGIWVLVALLAWGAWAAYRHRVKIQGRVLVNLLDGTGIEGTLIRTTGKQLVLAQAKLVGESTEPIPLDGTVYVERSTVHFVQGY